MKGHPALATLIVGVGLGLGPSSSRLFQNCIASAATKACSKESNGLKAVMEGVVLISPISDLGINHLVTSTHVSSFFLHLEQQLAEEGIFDEGSFLPKLSKS